VHALVEQDRREALRGSSSRNGRRAPRRAGSFARNSPCSISSSENSSPPISYFDSP
jgi:hypothetical protein